MDIKQVEYYDKYFLGDTCEHELWDYEECKNVYQGTLTQGMNTAVKTYIAAFDEVINLYTYKSERMPEKLKQLMELVYYITRTNKDFFDFWKAGFEMQYKVVYT